MYVCMYVRMYIRAGLSYFIYQACTVFQASSLLYECTFLYHAMLQLGLLKWGLQTGTTSYKFA